MASVDVDADGSRRPADDDDPAISPGRPGRPRGKGAMTSLRIRPGDRMALSVWGGAWLGVMLFVAVVPRVLPSIFDGRPFLERWAQWDAVRFLNLATYGYDGVPGQPVDEGWPAFFPGYPLLLRAVGVVTGDYLLAGIVISLVAGAVTMLALGRLGDFEGPEGTGSRAAVALVAAPPAVFLFAGYSESVFLALILPAWLLARRGQWAGAAVLAAFGSCVRITGLFFALALITEYVLGEHGRRKVGWRLSGWLLVPFVPLFAYSAYQWNRTGDWLAWQHAQEKGWDRKMVPPWESFMTTWRAAFEYQNEFTLAFRMELAGALVGVLLVIFLLVMRRWPELVYVGLQVAAFMLSSYYMSIGRATLLWWPLWVGLGTLAVRRPAVFGAIVALSAPFAVLLLLTFTSGQWAG